MIASPLPSPPRKSPTPRDQQRADRRCPATGPPARGRATGSPATGHQGQADPGEHGEQRRGAATGERLREARASPSGSRGVEDVGGDHAEQRQAARHVEADEAVGRRAPGSETDLARAGRRVADGLALLLGRPLQLGLEVDHPLLQRRVGRRRGCGRRAGRRCGRCRPRRWRPARRPASARSRAASPCRRGASAAPVRRSPGSGVTEASMPGRWAAPPAPAMITWSPRPAASRP